MGTRVTSEVHTGGCQCGAVRYRVTGELGNAGICHCRMCQKASGNAALPLVSIPVGNLQWTRGEPAEFRSSPPVRRGFCKDCGTPLYMFEDGLNVWELTIGSLDNPNAAAPDHAVGIESKLDWFDRLSGLPAITTQDDRAADELAGLTSNQHPDHDTSD
jgi:hypothetical protein